MTERELDLLHYAAAINTMRFIDALKQCPTIPIFGRIEGIEEDTDDIRDWQLTPIEAPALRKSEVSEFFIVKAIQVLQDGTTRDCYMDVSLPERINDYAYFLHSEEIEFQYTHEYEGEVICAVPIDCFGDYNLFYSRIAPDVGINILTRGLDLALHKQHIAEDLGYILRDERRFAEAAKAFRVAVDGEPTSYFIYGELANCYAELGDFATATKYFDLFNAHR